jgi:hypothetical protein
MEKVARVAAYWLTVLMLLWFTSYLSAQGFEKGEIWLWEGNVSSAVAVVW